MEPGFALVISLSLMVLLTILAVGLLTLSTVSIRSAGQSDSLSVARANARMALALAIGQLQKSAGPDQRITAPANAVDSKFPPGVTGAWKSWRPPQDSPDYKKERTDRFMGYLMSNPDPSTKPDLNTLPKGSSSGSKGSLSEQLLVGPGSLGKDATTSEVRAPMVALANIKGKASTGGLAWTTLDEGVKGRIDLAPADQSKNAVGETVARMGAPARNKAGKLKGMDFLEGKQEELAGKLPKLVSTGEVDLAATDKETSDRYFNDFSVSSNSLQTDTANGGLKTDLSVLFDTATLPSDFSTRRVYSNTNTPLTGATNSDPLWAAYQHYYRLYQRTNANDNPKAGLKAYVTRNFRLAQTSDVTLRDVRFEPNMSTLRESILMPTLAKVDIVFSLIARDVHGGRAAALNAAGYPYMLHLMYMPVITLHNPYNVPLRFTEIEMEFADLPMGFQFFINGQAATSDVKAFNQLYVGNEGGGSKKIFKMILTGDVAAAKEVVMGPGETRIFGKPFPPTFTWEQDREGDGNTMFDWRNDKTQQGKNMAPGMIAGPSDGVGYDVDWLAPSSGTRASWLTARTGEGIIPMKPTETVMVKYGPKPQPSTPNNKFSITMRLKTGSTVLDYATTQVFFQNEGKLKTVLEEGTSPRFPETRSFPETFPKPTVEAPITGSTIYESNGTMVKNYKKAKPFAIFSLSGKTTQESFTRSRPAADTGAAVQMATCEFISGSSQGANPYEFILTPVRAGTAAIEVDGEKAFFFGGHGATRGSTSGTYYEIPVAPLQSVAQLRHANVGTMGAPPYFTYTVGESRAHPALPPASARFSAGAGKTYLDHSWLANDQMWDRYFFSTLATLQGTGYTGSAAKSQTDLANDFFNGKAQLPNSRNTAFLRPGLAPGTAATNALETGGLKSAAYLMTRGGFNVNSTSESAWIAVLSAMSDAPVPLANGSVESTGDNVPILRTRRPALSSNSGGTARDQLWNSYRKLSPAEVETLAKEIVKQVRERGPFLSMSDFVNRHLSGDDMGKKGALQAAIDQSGINGIVNSNAVNIAAADVANYGWKNAPAIVNTSTGSGTPGDISQGDVLTAIGSFATVRSDTFKIRAYGEARDPDGKVTARAWCEAVVQRVPDYVDSADSPELVATQPANVAFGRRFQTVSFRWMNQDEV
ncbi:hypothetical protein [Haloferula sp. BvORR071]|uniref:hypothetical protein n=1 Tax=Haloferula sp. BvORR071 TaxID=1396141 RepID=UPI000555D7E9|nr:hypothetical protein [Haloferula sp. BvORR071]